MITFSFILLFWCHKNVYSSITVIKWYKRKSNTQGWRRVTVVLGYPREAGYGVCFIFFISVFSVRIDTGRPMEVKEKVIQSVTGAGLDPQVCSPWSCPRSCIQKGPTLHLMLCCCYPEIFDNFFFFFNQEALHFHFALGTAKYGASLDSEAIKCWSVDHFVHSHWSCWFPHFPPKGV